MLDLLAAGRARDLVPAVGRADWDDPDQRRAATAALGGAVARAAELAAVHSGAARWRHSWSGPVELVDRAGQPVDLDRPATDAVTDPSAVPALRAALARLGVEEPRGTQAEEHATARTADVIGAISDVRLGGERHDLLILDEGLVFVPTGRSAAAAGGAKGELRLHLLLRSADVASLAAWNRWVPYEDIAAVSVRRRLPTVYEIRLHDGSVLDLKVTLGGDELGKSEKTLGAVLGRFA